MELASSVEMWKALNLPGAPVVSKRSQIAFKLMRKQLYFSLDLVPQ